MELDHFPHPVELFNEHYPDGRLRLSLRPQENEHDLDNFIGGVPKNKVYLCLSLARGSWNSNQWEKLQEAYESEGFDTHLRKSNGTTRTRSGICRHAKTQLYVW